MDKLLEIKVGGGSVRSGWVPLSALAMVKDLLAAIAAEGADEDIWKSLDPQVEVIGKSSTLLAVHTNFARKLRPQVKTFREKARNLVLNPEGREFIREHIATPSARWTYVEVIEVPDKNEAAPAPKQTPTPVLRFDARYKERYLEKQAEPIHGMDEVYAVIMRAGGAQEPKVTLRFPTDELRTCSVRGRDLARRIAAHLYETVKLKVEVWWNAKTLEREKMVVHDLLDWKDVHLAEVYREHGNRLPIRLTVNSVEQLLQDRESDRGE
jgi:hypothetical protein